MFASVPLSIVAVTILVASLGFIFVAGSLFLLTYCTLLTLNTLKAFRKIRGDRARTEALYRFIPVMDIVNLINEYDLVSLNSLQLNDRINADFSGKVLVTFYHQDLFYRKFINRSILRRMVQNAYRDALMPDTKVFLTSAGRKINDINNKHFIITPSHILIDGKYSYDNLVFGLHFGEALIQAYNN